MPANMTPFEMYQTALTHFHATIKEPFERLITQTAGLGAIDEATMIQEVKQVAQAISEQFPDGPLTRDDLVLLLNTEWNRLADRYEQGVRDDTVYQREVATEGRSYSTRCPFCGSRSRLSVVQVTLTFHHRENLEVDSPLAEDGFDVSAWIPAALGHSDCTTEEEQVACSVCDHQFEISFVAFASFSKEVTAD